MLRESEIKEIALALAQAGADGGEILAASCVDDWMNVAHEIAPCIEYLLTEREAATVQQMLEYLETRHCAEVHPSTKRAALREVLEDLRAFSPDLEWLPRQKKWWELEARLMEERVYGYHDPVTHTLERIRGEVDCGTCQRIADLDRQFAALAEVKK